VPPTQSLAVQPFCKPEVAALFVSFLLCATPAWSRQHDMHTPGMHAPATHTHDMSGANHRDTNAPTVAADPALTAKRLSWKRESELVHHLAGLLVLLAGLFILGEDRLAKRWSSVRYAWPMCFLAAGLFLLVFSDTEIWPFGHQTPWYAVTHNTEDLQHKVFSFILLAIGYVEFQRTRGRFNGAWTGWLFPVAAIAGAILLLFHVHSDDMRAPHAMETMEHVLSEHRWFASVGFGIALTKGLAETTSKRNQIFKIAWPSLLIVLGVLLMLYTE
jgi:hypothetical protein